MNRKAVLVVGLVVCFVLLFAPAAQAYLDPGAGSLILQAVIGGILAVGVVVKSFGGRLWAFLTGRSRRRGVDQVTEEVD